MEKPTIVCLCGSTRFSDAYRKANLDETLAGRIVLTIGCDFKSADALELTDEDKTRLDELHLRKIDLADEVLVLNVGDYIGESTGREVAYAIAAGKRVRYLESPCPSKMTAKLAQEAGAEEGEAARAKGIAYSPVTALLRSDQWATKQMMYYNVPPSIARQWMQEWIIGYACAWPELD